MLYLPTLTYTHTALHNDQECQIQNENPQTAQVPGNSLVVQSLGLCASTAGDLGSIPGWETRIPQASQHSQRKKKKKIHKQSSQCSQSSQSSHLPHPIKSHIARSLTVAQ